jgi:hypothetical protein
MPDRPGAALPLRDDLWSGVLARPDRRAALQTRSRSTTVNPLGWTALFEAINLSGGDQR